MQLKVLSSGSRGNAYILETDNEILLIECGVNVNEIKQAIRFNVSKVSGCIVTHEHKDHSCAIKPMLTMGVPIFASEGTLRACDVITHHRAQVLEPKKQFTVGSFKIMPFDVKHDAEQPFGYMIEHEECGRVLFLTDTYYCKYTFPKLNNILIEANYATEIIYRKMGRDSGKEFLKNRIVRSHFSLENCMGLLEANDLTAVNNIVLIHLSDSNSDEKMFVREVEKLTGKTVTAASKGLSMQFNKTPF